MKRWKVRDLMSRDVVAVGREMGYREVADLLVKHMISAVPVIDDDRRVLGVISEVDLIVRIEYADRRPHHPLAVRRMNRLRHSSGATAGELMSAPAITIAADASVVEAARRLDASRVKRLPVVDEPGRLVGIVSRRDLVRLYTRPDAILRGDVIDSLRDGFQYGLTSLDVDVRKGVVTLEGAISRPGAGRLAVDLARSVPGVVSVIDNLIAANTESADAPGDRQASQIA